MGIFWFAFSTSDFFGKLIFVALFALSLITWFVLIQKIWHIQHVRRVAVKLQEAFSGASDSILNFSVEEQNPFAKIYQSLKTKAIEILDKNHFFHKHASVFLTRGDVELIATYVDATISAEGKKLEKNLFILSTAVSLAPFLGILGTVWGILISLGELRSGGSLQSNSLILGGLSTALATTVLGLVIAIPALIAYNYLRTHLTHFYGEMHDFSSFLLSSLEIQYRKVES